MEVIYYKRWLIERRKPDGEWTYYLGLRECELDGMSMRYLMMESNMDGYEYRLFDNKLNKIERTWNIPQPKGIQLPESLYFYV